MQSVERQRTLCSFQAPDPRAPAAPADAEWFYCRAEGCGRRFGSGEKLAAHVQRRHQQDEVLET